MSFLEIKLDITQKLNKINIQQLLKTYKQIQMIVIVTLLGTALFVLFFASIQTFDKI